MSAPAPQLEAVAPGIGVVAPFDLALDRELWRWTPPPVSLYVTRTAPVDGAVSVDQAHALGDLAAITDACRNVSSASPAVTAYLCTSASFVSGVAGEARVRAAMEAGGARHAITTSGALLEAVRALGAQRLAVGTPYDAALTERLVAFLSEAGVATSGTRHLGMGGGHLARARGRRPRAGAGPAARRRRRRLPRVHEPPDLRRRSRPWRPSWACRCCRPTS